MANDIFGQPEDDEQVQHRELRNLMKGPGGAAGSPVPEMGMPMPKSGNTGVTGNIGAPLGPLTKSQVEPMNPGAPSGYGDKGQILASISGPVDPAKRQTYDAGMADITRRQQALDPLTGGPGLASLMKEKEALQRDFFGEGYLGGGGGAGGMGQMPRSVNSDEVASMVSNPSQSKASAGAPTNSWRDYLLNAARTFQPELHKSQGEQARKSAAEGWLNSVVPEIQKRGGNARDVRGENLTIDGRVYDIFRDIEGAGEAQLLDKTDEIAADKMRAQMGPSAQPASATADPAALSESDMLQRLIARMRGEAGVNDDAMRSLMREARV